jgi:hypothetical protein
MYRVKRNGALWQVLNSENVLQFQSLRRANCTDWVRDNTKSPAPQSKQT